MTEKGYVFVIQEVSKFNVIPCQEYGTLVPVFEEGKQIMLSPAPAIRKLKQVLKNFNDKDYLLLIGDPSIIGVACSIASDINQGKYKMLKYDSRSYTYYPIQVDLYERSMKHDGYK